MKRSHPPKTTYNKLYLIEEEMYNRILPKLSEVEKQEFNDLNENNKPCQDFEENICEYCRLFRLLIRYLAGFNVDCS